MLDIQTEGRHTTGMDGFLNFVAQQALKEAFSAGENGEIPVAAAVFIPEEKKIIAMASTERNRTTIRPLMPKFWPSAKLAGF